MRCVCCRAHELHHNGGVIAKMLLYVNYCQELAYYTLYSCLSSMLLTNSKYIFCSLFSFSFIPSVNLLVLYILQESEFPSLFNDCILKVY